MAKKKRKKPVARRKKAAPKKRKRVRKPRRKAVRRKRVVRKKQTAAHLKSKLCRMANDKLRDGLYRRDKATTAKQHKAAQRTIDAARKELNRYE